MKITTTSFVVPEGLQVYILIGMVRVQKSRVLPAPTDSAAREAAMTELVEVVRAEAVGQGNAQLSALSVAIDPAECSAALIDLGVSTGADTDVSVSRLHAEIVGKVVLCRSRTEGDPVVHPRITQGPNWVEPSEQAPAEGMTEPADSDSDYPGLYL